MITIETKKQYDEAMSRIEELYRQTDKNTPADAPMMQATAYRCQHRTGSVSIPQRNTFLLTNPLIINQKQTV